MEHRSEAREKAGFHGLFHVGADGPGVPCAVRDLSSRGARLSFLEPASVPDRFALSLSETGETCSAVVRWRQGMEVGVAFEERGPGLDLAWSDPEERSP